MKNLVAISFNTIDGAEDLKRDVRQLESESLILIEDLVMVIRNEDGKVKLNQDTDLTLAGAVEGGLWGALVGVLIFSPLAGAAMGAIAGAFRDMGIDDRFMKEAGKELEPGSSALFLLTGRSSNDEEKVLERLKGLGGKVLKTSLPEDAERRIQAALDGQTSPG